MTIGWVATVGLLLIMCGVISWLVKQLNTLETRYRVLNEVCRTAVAERDELRNGIRKAERAHLMMQRELNKTKTGQ